MKASRFITHIKRLREVGFELALFLERADRLGPKLGPILFQLPPTQPVKLTRLGDFLALLQAFAAGSSSFATPAGTPARCISCSPTTASHWASRSSAA